MGKFWASPSCRHNHRLQGATSHTFGQRETAHALVLATVGSNSVPSSALSQWLVGIDVEHGPDGRSSPTFLKQNFNCQEAADLYQAAHLHTLEDLAEQGPYPKGSSASLRSGSSPMSIPWKPSLQFIFSRLQGICRTSSPTTSGLRR